MGAGRHALGGLVGGEHRADREAAAETLGQRHDVGRHADLLVAEHLAEPADAGLHLVEGEQQAVLVAELAQVAEELRRRRAHAALALHRLDEDAGGLGRDGALERLEVAERHLVEALQRPGRSRRDTSCSWPPPSVASVRPWNAPSKVMMR